MSFPVTMRGNMGRMHRTRCEWCGLKTSCNCLIDGSRDTEDNDETHPSVLCPRCQVIMLLNKASAAVPHRCRARSV